MGNPERRNMVRLNIMTAYTKAALEEALIQARRELNDASLAIGEAAGRESDWHDNAAFDYANIEFDLKSASLASLIRKLQDVEIITPRKQTDLIDIGNTVIVKFENEIDEERFTILGPDDSGRKAGWLSCFSPLGASLIGRSEGEIAEYSLEQGRTQKVKVIKILRGDFE
jgi:transcription elongation factor GreA